MKRPTWATVVGILGIIFGLGGLLNSALTAAMPKMLEKQRVIMADMEKVAKEDPKQAASIKEAQDTFEKMWKNLPPWFNAVSVGMGLAGIAVNCFYIFAAITLLLVRQYALRLFYIAVALSIILVAAKSVTMAAVFSTAGPSTLMIGLIGAVLDLVLLIVVLTGDKSAFRQNTVPA